MKQDLKSHTRPESRARTSVRRSLLNSTPRLTGLVFVSSTEASPRPLRLFDVKTCRNTLADHYQRNAKVPTSVWSSRCNVNIRDIYTRLSWVKEERNQSGSTRSKLDHYTDLFAENKTGVLPKRILVQGMPGIGKSTFVKKLAVDWAELDWEERCDRRTDILRKFELAVIIKLREVSHCKTLRDALRNSYIFPAEEARQVDNLLEYIATNQERVLLVCDGYDEYRCGCDSELYQIFRGNALRNCCVLVTTRPSRADDLLEYAEMCAEITGFNKEDRKHFMTRILESEIEAKRLYAHLERSNLIDQARVPILLLFFCTLWKKGKASSFPSDKTELYLAIVQYILDYSEARHSRPPRFGKVDDYTEILAEMGKVALESLLEDDLLFEYHRLSEAVRCEKSIILGFLQIIDCAENLRPAGMVSFIHKSIQEFLAAWYITHRRVPKDILFDTEERVRTLEACEGLDTVFQFVCGLSNKGAEKVLQHLQSVRVSDPSLCLSETMPDFPRGPDAPCFTFTSKQRRFQDLVFNSFRESRSKRGLLKLCFDCTGGIVLVPGELSERGVPKVGDITQVTDSGIFIFEEHSARVLKQSLDLLGCLEIPLTITENCQYLNIGDLLSKMLNIGQDQCGFTSILSFQNGQIRFFITDLYLHCDNHAKLFTETGTNPVRSPFANCTSEDSSLKFLRCLRCYDHLSSQTMKDVGAMVATCEQLTRIETEHITNDSICDLLEQVRNPSACCLEIGYYRGRLWLHSEGRGSCTLTSTGMVRLASLLPRFTNTTIVSLRLLPGCSAKEVNTLVANITHRTLKLLELREICLTPKAAADLGRSIPEMSSLKILQLSRPDGIGQELECEQFKLLFGGFKHVSPLEKISLKGFRLKGGLAPFTNSLCFFPSLKVLHLKDLSMDEEDLCSLLANLRFIPHLRMLNLKGNSLGHAVRSIVQHIAHVPVLQFLVISRTECLEEDWNYVAKMLKEIRPKLSVS